MDEPQYFWNDQPLDEFGDCQAFRRADSDQRFVRVRIQLCADILALKAHVDAATEFLISATTARSERGVCGPPCRSRPNSGARGVQTEWIFSAISRAARARLAQKKNTPNITMRALQGMCELATCAAHGGPRLHHPWAPGFGPSQYHSPRKALALPSPRFRPRSFPSCEGQICVLPKVS